MGPAEGLPGTPYSGRHKGEPEIRGARRRGNMPLAGERRRRNALIGRVTTGKLSPLLNVEVFAHFYDKVNSDV